ncbi:mammalian cell entry protein [Mycobacterium vulneris]|uniref:Mammalian cell entry protein n=1 Tax=Mycolicibacterium vulneris TaxID=547163 RepID=A0A1X2LC67_9MYCO|nr:MCE family protein [Mycolicibacterium vulneris]OSC31568.1 mammalian cell entry protein [Mycolicibacterium vulneris]
MRKPLSQRNPLIVGAIGIVVTAGLVMGALQWQELPFLKQGKEFSAYFADAGGLFGGAGVEVSGYPVGKVSSIALQESGVLVQFNIASNIHLGELTEAAIKAKSLLGAKILEVTPRGGGQLAGPIPIERTTSPYQLPDALGDLTTTISGLDTHLLSDSLATLARTFADTPPDLKNAVQGVARFAQTLDSRDAQLRSLLDNAAKATGVLAKRTDQVVGLVRDTNALLAQLRTQSSALDQITVNISAVSRQLKGLISENRQQLQPALDKLNGVLTIVDNRKERIQQAIKGLNTYAMSLGESLASGPFFNAYVANVLPGQFLQPFISSAFSDLGLDPATLLPSQITDPQTGQAGTPPLPVPYPRTGQGGPPRTSIPDAITGNPADHPCGPPGAALPGPGCYPYRQPPPAPPPGGPPPGGPAVPIPAPTSPPINVDVGPPNQPGGQP